MLPNRNEEADPVKEPWRREHRLALIGIVAGAIVTIAVAVFSPEHSHTLHRERRGDAEVLTFGPDPQAGRLSPSPSSFEVAKAMTTATMGSVAPRIGSHSGWERQEDDVTIPAGATFDWNVETAWPWCGWKSQPDLWIDVYSADAPGAAERHHSSDRLTTTRQIVKLGLKNESHGPLTVSRWWMIYVAGTDDVIGERRGVARDITYEYRSTDTSGSITRCGALFFLATAEYPGRRGYYVCIKPGTLVMLNGERVSATTIRAGDSVVVLDHEDSAEGADVTRVEITRKSREE